ncbi:MULTISPECIES: MBL fold metallo-hydrolase [Isoptericola]|uniref:MBL fold metallo-hydrolase n=1 Tax=Isoptericola sediminis TaxID=2733572 RepID=A0A849K9V8_9MICO|nr:MULTISPECIES: MBL fold metallo-hydrolase [Isoptericola]MDO8144416.1 MBL fold metallo-hydrolase [Isoptericola sp. 178]MDO8148270.1 MBL fold metallo-hydrolase [Isoptericola sp. b515]MDO8151751.1 MBL fold metallo-hydrolase [Isoptericola sp. b408]NNU28017.1 MBL fold metallo-hydrolase [Isoptericola sediminis]
MRLVTVGVSGSLPGPDSPASCYLVQADDAERTWNVVLDLGSGALGPLQRHVDPADLDAIGLSHLHPDHCSDLSGLYVYLKYHPERGVVRTGVPRELPVLGPSATCERAAAMYGLEPGEDMATEYAFRTWEPGSPVRVGPMTLEPFRVNHPVEAYGVRVTGPSSDRAGESATLVFSGDTDMCPGLVEGARGADLLLCEAAFLEGRDDGVERGIHLTGRRAGKVAAEAAVGRLLLTHLPAWTDPADTLAEARGVFDGPTELAVAGGVHTL